MVALGVGSRSSKRRKSTRRIACGIAPSVEVIGNQSPGRKVMWQHPPSTTAASHVKQGVDDVAQVITSGPPTRATPWRTKQMLNVIPLNVREVAGISLPCAHAVKVKRSSAGAKPNF